MGQGFSLKHLHLPNPSWVIMCKDKMMDMTHCYYSTALLCLIQSLLCEALGPEPGIWVTPVMVM